MLGPASSREPVFHLIGEQPPFRKMIWFSGPPFRRLPHVDASHALMVGDSPADIDAARAAGVQSIALRGGYTTVAADALGADLVIDGLGDLATAMETLAPAIRQA